MNPEGRILQKTNPVSSTGKRGEKRAPGVLDWEPHGVSHAGHRLDLSLRKSAKHTHTHTHTLFRDTGNLSVTRY